MALKETKESTGLPKALQDYTYSKVKDLGAIRNLQYADNICCVGVNCSYSIEAQKESISDVLKARNLDLNEAMTEE